VPPLRPRSHDQNSGLTEVAKLLSPRGHGLPATAGGVGTHRDPITSRFWRRYEFSGVFENTPRDAGGATWRESICVGITEMGPEVNALPHTIIESPCLGECLHSDSITFVDIISSSQTPTMK
jgi:hypothetical protein